MLMENKGTDDSYSHILKYTGLFGGVQGLNILIGLIRTKLVALILGPHGMGLISLYNSTIKLVSDSSNLGLSMSAVKNLSPDFEAGREQEARQTIKLIRSWSCITALAGMLLCALLSPLLNQVTFNAENHTLQYFLLSPVVGLLAVTSGETAILKSARRLRQLATISVYNVIGLLVTSIPIYILFGEPGIVPSLLVGAFVQMLLTIGYSYKLFPPRISLSFQFLRNDHGMIKLGIAFVLAGILGSGAEFAIRSFLNRAGSLDTVGLYNAAYMMVMTYAGVVFTSMETDYFPRLSAARRESLNEIVNRQIEVSLLVVSPLLIVFIIGMPILLPLLYSGKFMPVLGMIQVSVLAMYLRAINLPIAYIPLSRGDSKSYLLMEGIYDMAMVLLVITGYRHQGLFGIGVALTALAVTDFIVLCLYMRHKYGYRLSASVLKYAAVQCSVGLLAYALTRTALSWLYWAGGIGLFCISAAFSLWILGIKKNTP